MTTITFTAHGGVAVFLVTFLMLYGVLALIRDVIAFART